jgi:hypothetical protein
VADPINTGFDPLFGDPLRQLIERAKAEGYNPSIISGVRDDESQRQLVENAKATRAGLPLPYPERGPVQKAAPVGFSAHEYGVAGDVSGVPQAELARLAPQFGLNTISGDPGHVELGNWRRVASNQPPPIPWSEVNPANVPAQMAMAVDQPPGTSLNTSGNHADFITNYAKQIGLDPNLALGIAQKEGLNAWSASNPNAASYVDRQNGQPFSFGDFQLNVHPGAMGAQALAHNIDPRDPSQWQAADKFALDQMKAGGVGPWKGDPVAAAYLKTGGAPPAAPVGPGPGNVGPATGFLPGPTAGAPSGQGGIGSDAAAAAPAAAAPAAASPLAALAKPLQELGKDASDSGQQQQQGGDQAAQLQAQQAAAMAGLQRQQELKTQGAQLMAAILAQGKRPLSWGSAPPGAEAGLQLAPMSTATWGGVPVPMPGGTPTPGGGRIGTTLNSMGEDVYG